MTAPEQTTAAVEGPAWSAGASVLDVGCGSGELCELAAARGARVSGIDGPAASP